MLLKINNNHKSNNLLVLGYVRMLLEIILKFKIHTLKYRRSVEILDESFFFTTDESLNCTKV